MRFVEVMACDLEPTSGVAGTVLFSTRQWEWASVTDRALCAVVSGDMVEAFMRLFGLPSVRGIQCEQTMGCYSGQLHPASNHNAH